MPEANHIPQSRRPLWATLGPSLVVLGSVVGSGELINTPVQAAKFGFIFLWAVLLACVLRFFLQIEIGRHCLVHRRTTVQALNSCPGPRWRNTSWVGLLYILIYPMMLLPSVGMIGALSALSTSMSPLAKAESTSDIRWAVLLVILTWAVLSGGIYKHLERLVIALVAIFSLTTIGAVLLIQGTPYRITGAEFLSGLNFSLGDDRGLAVYVIVAFMGGLGVTANELFMYPYWIQEKGYGIDLQHHEGEAWTVVARRWIRSIWFDVSLATLLATLVTAAFYLLGAAVLHRQHVLPEGTNVVRKIGQVYVDSYGPWSLKFFYFGAFCTMWSTMIVTIAASSRMVSDVLGSLGFINRNDPAVARRVHRVAQPLFLIAMFVTYLLLQMSPANIVILGHFLSGGFAMPLIMLGICWIAFHTDQRVRMNRVTATFLILTSIVVLICALFGVAYQVGALASPPR